MATSNSPAVVIGAMLLSSLMGPKMDVGLNLGMSDFEPLNKSVNNLIVAKGIDLLHLTTMLFPCDPLS